jgi:Fur family ferric uptake transcriptional regulator
MDAIDEISNSLRSSGHRLTRSRKAVIQVLAEATDWLQPQEVHARGLRLCPSLGLVTVYRTLSLLESFGYVSRVHLEDRCHGYARTELAHGHHLVCRSCHQVVEFPGLEELPALIGTISRKTGFVVEGHMLALLGLCPACQ